MRGIDFLHEVRAKTAAWAGPSVSDDLGFLDKFGKAERVTILHRIHVLLEQAGLARPANMEDSLAFVYQRKICTPDDNTVEWRLHELLAFPTCITHVRQDVTP